MSMRFYPRANPDDVADRLHRLADTIASVGWEERGGFLIRGDDGQVVARTKWIPRAQWWAERPDRLGEQQYAGVLLKHMLGVALTKRERNCLLYMIEAAGIEAAPIDSSGSREDYRQNRLPMPEPMPQADQYETENEIPF